MSQSSYGGDPKMCKERGERYRFQYIGSPLRFWSTSRNVENPRNLFFETCKVRLFFKLPLLGQFGFVWGDRDPTRQTRLCYTRLAGPLLTLNKAYLSKDQERFT